ACVADDKWSPLSRFCSVDSGCAADVAPDRVAAGVVRSRPISIVLLGAGDGWSVRRVIRLGARTMTASAHSRRERATCWAYVEPESGDVLCPSGSSVWLSTRAR